LDISTNFLHCNDDDGSTERTSSRQTAASIGGHPLGRSRSQPPPVRGLVSDSQDTIANYRTVMRTSGIENVDNSVRPRPVQPQPTVCGLVRHQLGPQSVNQGVHPGNAQFIDKLSGSDVLLAHTSALQRQDTLPWPPGQEDAPRPVSTQPLRPTQRSVAAMQTADAPPGFEDVPMPTHRPTGTQMDFQPRPTMPVSTQPVSDGDPFLSTRLPRATGAHTGPSLHQADQMPSTDLTSRDMQSRPLPPGSELQSQYVMPPGMQCGEFCTPSVSTHLSRAVGNSVEFLQCTPPTHTGSVDHINLTLPVGADAYIPPRQDAQPVYAG